MLVAIRCWPCTPIPLKLLADYCHVTLGYCRHLSACLSVIIMIDMNICVIYWSDIFSRLPPSSAAYCEAVHLVSLVCCSDWTVRAVKTNSCMSHPTSQQVHHHHQIQQRQPVMAGCFLLMICRRPSMQDLLSHCLNIILSWRSAIKIVPLIRLFTKDFSSLNILWNVILCFVSVVVIFSHVWVILIMCLSVVDFVTGRDATKHWLNILIVNLTYRPQRITVIGATPKKQVLWPVKFKVTPASWLREIGMFSRH